MADQRWDITNRFDGRAENVIQSGPVYGDLHVHAPDQTVPPPSQVPPPSRCYTNNERQLDELTRALLPGQEAVEARIAVIRGAPGGGKSDTAYQWVHAHRERFPDGQFYVRYDPDVPEQGGQSEALLQFLVAAGYDPQRIPPTLDGRSALFRSWSTGKSVVVVIDDAVSAAQVRPLVPGEGNSAVLVTEAGPLAMLRARGHATFVDLDPLSPESARLLLSRIVGDTRQLPGEGGDVDELIRLCGGSTTALCVSGALLAEYPHRPVAWLVRELSREGRRLKILSADDGLSVRSVLNTAVKRLDDDARMVYRAFGHHAGPGDISLDVVTAAVEQEEEDVRDALERLLATRLIREAPEGRYFADALVRDHAASHSDPDPALRERFDEYYVLRALAAGHAAMPGRGWLEECWPERLQQAQPYCPPDPVAWLERERSNLRAVAARQYNLGNESVCVLSVALWPLHERGKHIDDMDLINDQAEQVAASRDDTFVRSLVLIQRGFAFRHRGELDKAVELFTAAEELAREHGSRELEATAVESWGLAQRDRGAADQAGELLARNLTMALEWGTSRRIALARMHLASVSDPDVAVPMLDEAIRDFRRLTPPDEYNAAKATLWRGKSLIAHGDLDASSTALREALQYMREHGHHVDVAHAHEALAERAHALGDVDTERLHLTEAVASYRMRGFLERAERLRARLEQQSS